ncbi:MAG: hypothetical protein VX923_03650 [Pseudomonadota bacterium]|nr:hypothetical protein [Pseudomonadota bacterium]
MWKKSKEDAILDTKSIAFRVLLSDLGNKTSDDNTRKIAQIFCNIGLDVIFTDECYNPTEIALAAVQEDVNALGINLQTIANMESISKIHKMLREFGAQNIQIFAYNVKNDNVVENLRNWGLTDILVKDTPYDEFVSRIQNIVSRHRGK